MSECTKPTSAKIKPVPSQSPNISRARKKLAGEFAAAFDCRGMGGTAVGSFMTLANTAPALNGESMKGDRSRTMPQPGAKGTI